MDINELIKATKTVHSFKPDCDLKLDKLHQLLATSFWVPNHKLTKPWKVFCTESGVARNEFMQFATQNMLEKAESLKKKWEAVPFLILFCAKDSPDPIVAKENYASVCCAIQLFALQLRNLGYGYKWATPKDFYKVDFASYFQESTPYQFVAMIVVGHEVEENLTKPRPTRGEASDYFWIK